MKNQSIIDMEVCRAIKNILNFLYFPLELQNAGIFCPGILLSAKRLVFIFIYDFLKNSHFTVCVT